MGPVQAPRASRSPSGFQTFSMENTSIDAGPTLDRDFWHDKAVRRKTMI